MRSFGPLVDRVLLIGMMGAGKSTVGTALAARLSWAYCDSDDQVQQRTAMTVPEIFATSGEAAFRKEEASALAEAVSSDRPVVISVAGGAVLDPDNRAAIEAAGLVVWLRAQLATLAERVGDGTGRPLLGDDPPAALARLYAERRPLYEQLADVVVDVDGRATADIVEEIAGHVPANPSPRADHQ
jgi:shikimate kinase